MSRLVLALRAAAAVTAVDAVEDRRHPLHVGLLVVGTLVPALVHRFVAELVPTAPLATVGGDYLTFGIVGLAVVALLDGTLRAGAARLQALQDRGTLTSLLVEPAPWQILPVAVSVWPAALYTATATGVLLLGAGVGARLRSAGVGTLLVVGVLGLVAAAGLAMLAGAVLVLAKRAEPVIRLFTFGAALLAGTVFPVTLLPEPLGLLGRLLPHTHAIHAARHAVMATPPTGAPGLAESLVWLAGLGAAFVVVGGVAFDGALRVGRRAGLLGSH